MRKEIILTLAIGLVAILSSCQPKNKTPRQMNNEIVRLLQLNPGHFHAGLVQKSMYRQVDSVVHVYAPEGPDLGDYLDRITSYNSREYDPTRWALEVYTGPDYLERMLEEKAGNVMVTAGNNAKKTEYIKTAVEAGLHVFADKPMVIDHAEFPMLLEAFRLAEQNGVLLYDIMTERYEITTILQKELSLIPDVFGELTRGTPEEPAITKESVHHLFKYVSGNPVRRPVWFFDVTQQGSGLSDVGTHLVDLVQWECFPQQVIDYESDIDILSARGWTTDMTPEEFEKVTGTSRFPEFLSQYVRDGVLYYPCNGETTYTLRGVHARVSVIWNFQAPEGTGDTHYSIMRGSKSNLVIRQGEQEAYQPVLYLEALESTDLTGLAASLEQVQSEVLDTEYPGVKLVPLKEGTWKVDIPAKYKVGHEAHFTQVMEKYLDFLSAGKMPDWEVPNMIAKYYTTTRAQSMIAE